MRRRITPTPLIITLLLLMMIVLPAAALAGGEPPRKVSKQKAAAAEQVTDVAAEATPRFPDAMRNDDWAGQWATARAYTYNTEKAYGPGASIWVWRGESFNPNIDSTHELTREQGEAALELVHQAAGRMLVSKCAYPRHAVVFFDDEGQPVASVNVCFECGDILVYPDYVDDELEEKKYAIPSDVVDEHGLERQLFDLVHEAVMPRWADFFTALGVTVVESW